MKPEDYFKRYEQGFDIEPPTGHRKRFEARLDALQPKKTIRRRSGWQWSYEAMLAAAAVMLMFVFFDRDYSRYTEPESVTQVLEYYTSLLETEAEQVYEKIGRLDEESQKQIEEKLRILTDIELEEGSEALGEHQQITVIYNIYQTYSRSIQYIAVILEDTETDRAEKS